MVYVQDFTGHYCTLQEKEPCVPELALLKTGLPHFDVFVAASPLGDALVTAFNLPPASNAATLAIIRDQMKSQVQTTAAELQRQGFVSQTESDQQAELWKVLTLHSCIFGVLLCVHVCPGLICRDAGNTFDIYRLFVRAAGQRLTCSSSM